MDDANFSECGEACEQMCASSNRIDSHQGLEQMSSRAIRNEDRNVASIDNENAAELGTEDENVVEHGGDDENLEGMKKSTNAEGVPIDGEEDFGKIDVISITVDDILQFHFPSVAVAYLFYNWYGMMKGFSARKSKVLRNREGHIVQQTFVCHKQGFRNERWLQRSNRRREPKSETRCGCNAQIRVHVEPATGRWHVTYISDDHSHNLLGETLIGMLPAHRRMDDCDILQMNSLRSVGISVSHIYGSFAHHSGGYQRIGFRRKDMYNELGRQQRMQQHDERGALSYLRKLRTSDPAMFWKHTVDDNDRLQHLFWSDGPSQQDYLLFGDVVAFDATYRRNKYMCPLVVFSGVNHHHQTIIFAAALVANETEETYTWLLEQFAEVMKGKKPSSVITDGDRSMRNAISKVFPESHHRLCAWHLMRNATSNIANPGFTEKFRMCMLGDFEIGEFRNKWKKMITEFGVEHHPWIAELYEKRKMWSTAYIRGNFFAGFRTTSRCEGLHAQLGKFVHSKHNLTEFLHHFTRCLAVMRFRELEADYASVVGRPVLQTPFKEIESCAATVYTREIFFLFRPFIMRACRMNVDECKVTPQSCIYIISKSGRVRREWHVLVDSSTSNFKCSCLRMESFGIPCEHIVALLVYLGRNRLPEGLILSRWTKTAKDVLQLKKAGELKKTGEVATTDNCRLNRYLSMLVACKRLCDVASMKEECYEAILEKVNYEIELLEEQLGVTHAGGDSAYDTYDNIKDPVVVRTKGCGSRKAPASSVNRRTTKCSLCREPGHNRRNCPIGRDMGGGHPGSPSGYGNMDIEEEDEDNFDEDQTYVECGVPDLNVPIASESC